MSILANKDTYVVIQGGVAGVNAARRMAEFCYLIKRSLNVLAFVYPPDAGKTNEIPYGSGLVAIPIYKTVAEATKHHPQINTSLVYIGADRAMKGGLEALDDPHIKVVSMITEGVPEKDAKILGRHATKLGKVFNGPSSIGIVSAGSCRLGVIGGAFDNLVLSKLYREGSFGVITKSGGLSNEIIWICSQFADGITTAIGIGGDAYPGTDYVSYLEMFENDPQTKAVVIVGEMGGDLEERAAEWYGAKKRRVKLMAVVSGFCQESLPKGMKFGHAGAKEGLKGEGSARAKSDALKKAGAIVPATFGALGPAIKETYQGLLKSGQVKEPVELTVLPKLPKTYRRGNEGGRSNGCALNPDDDQRRSRRRTLLRRIPGFRAHQQRLRDSPCRGLALGQATHLETGSRDRQAHHDALRRPWSLRQRGAGDDHCGLCRDRAVPVGCSRIDHDRPSLRRRRDRCGPLLQTCGRQQDVRR